MSPRNGGRHCSKCDKIITDFSGMTNAEIIQFIEQRAGQRVCGRFKHTQAVKGDRLINTLLSLRQVLSRRWYLNPARIIIVSLTGILLLLNSCRVRNTELLGMMIHVKRHAADPPDMLDRRRQRNADSLTHNIPADSMTDNGRFQR